MPLRPLADDAVAGSGTSELRKRFYE
jgi:hypothetical protein